MRIAYVCADPGVPAFGCKGCSIHVQEVIRALNGQGARVELFASRFDGQPPPDIGTVRIHKLSHIPSGQPADRERAALAVNREVWATLEREGPFDLIYERYSLWSFAAMEYAQANGTPGILEVNAPLIEEQAEHRALVDRTSAEGVANRVFGAATVLIAVSEEVAAYLERYASARGRVHIVPNGANPERFRPGLRPSLPGKPGTFTVGFVGSMKPWHGLPILVAAFARLYRNYSLSRLLVVGDGPQRASLWSDLTARGLQDGSHLTGAVKASEVPNLLASLDVAVAPYPELPHFYFSPLKVCEYMAAGLPVVASRIDALAKLVQDGVNGLLFTPGDPVALAEALERLRQEPETRARLGRAARETLLREHTWEAVVRRSLQLASLEAPPRRPFAEVSR